MTAATASELPAPVRRFVRFLETGEADGVFADDLATELNFPHAQMHETSAAAMIALRRREHPGATEVHLERLDRTERGWVLQLEERWERGGERWYSRELFRVDVVDGRIVDFVVYCTGDWDEALQREYAVKSYLNGP